MNFNEDISKLLKEYERTADRIHRHNALHEESYKEQLKSEILKRFNA